MAVSFNGKHLAKFIRPEEYEAIYPQDELAHNQLESKTGAGNDFLGWLDLPVTYDKEEFARIQKAAKKIQSDSDVLVVIGIGGAYLTTCYSSTYTDGIVAGRGFIALAAVSFGRWNAGGILLACLFFGFCDALQIRLQVSGIAIPYQFFQMIPYVATVVVLSLIGTRQAGPKANGKPYRREQR